MLKVLDAAVNHVILLARQQQDQPPDDSDYTSDSSDVSQISRPTILFIIHVCIHKLSVS